MPSEKFELAPSRYHNWKWYTSPGATRPPGGNGSSAGTRKPGAPPPKPLSLAVKNTLLPPVGLAAKVPVEGS